MNELVPDVNPTLDFEVLKDTGTILRTVPRQSCNNNC